MCDILFWQQVLTQLPPTQAVLPVTLGMGSKFTLEQTMVLHVGVQVTLPVMAPLLHVNDRSPDVTA